MEKITLELTIEEANMVLAALGNQPYVKVADLIRKIQQQGAAQAQAQSANEADVVEPQVLESVN